MLTLPLAHQVAQTWLNDWNRHDLDAIMAHYANDVVFSSPFVVKLLGVSDGTLHGKAALQDYFAHGLTTYPTLQFTFIQLLVGVNSLALFYRSVNNLQAAEVMTLNSQGLITHVMAHYSITEI